MVVVQASLDGSESFCCANDEEGLEELSFENLTTRTRKLSINILSGWQESNRKC